MHCLTAASIVTTAFDWLLDAGAAHPQLITQAQHMSRISHTAMHDYKHALDSASANSCTEGTVIGQRKLHAAVMGAAVDHTVRSTLTGPAFSLGTAAAGAALSLAFANICATFCCDLCECLDGAGFC